MDNRKIGKHLPKRLVILALVFLRAVLSVPAFGEFPNFTEEISPNPVGRNDRFSLTILLDYEDVDQVSFDVSKLPEGVSLYRGPTIKPVWIQLEDASYVRKVSVVTSFKASREGRILFGQFALSVGDETVQTDYHILRVGIWKNRKLTVPIEPEWKLPDAKVYEGQATAVILAVRNMEEVTLFDHIAVEQPGGAMFERISGIGSIESNSFGDHILYDIPASSYMLTPSKPGRLVLPRAEVGTGEILGWSGERIVDVLALPEAVKTTGAVGSFSCTGTMERTDAVEGRELVFRLRVTGTGNLNYLQIPDPSCHGLTLLSKTDDGQYAPGEAGYTGFREAVYTFLPEAPGQAYINQSEFTFFDPTREKVITIPGKKYQVTVREGIHEAVESAPDDVIPFQPVDPLKERGSFHPGMYRNIQWYILLFPGPLALCIIWWIRKKPKALASMLLLFLGACSIPEVSDIQTAAFEAYSRGNFVEAAALYEESLRILPEDARGLYSYAVCLYLSGSEIEAYQAARCAVYHDPMFFRARRLMSWMEDQKGGGRGIIPSPFYHPDFFFIFLILCVNGASLFTILKIFRNRGMYAIAAILLIALAVPASGLLAYSAMERNHPAGMVYGEDVFLYKIPSKNAAPWIQTEGGITVKILQSASGYYLVQDDRGAEGWIVQDSVIRDSDVLCLVDEKKGIE